MNKLEVVEISTENMNGMAKKFNIESKELQK
jgi:hypothetical protein